MHFVSKHHDSWTFPFACVLTLCFAAGTAWADDCNSNGVPDDQETLGSGSRLYVRADATGANDGSSWTDALTEVEYALCIAENDPNFTEVWVAQGTYIPLRVTDPNDARSATFALLSGLALYGGFDGTETSLAERTGLFDQTILSGDLNGDDNGWNNRSDNSYNVLVGSLTDNTAVLDGFTVTAGQADGDEVDEERRGGGLYLDHGGCPTSATLATTMATAMSISMTSPDSMFV